MEYNPDEGWEYEDHPNYETVKEKCNEILLSMSNNEGRREAFLLDTRETHRYVYSDVTPNNCDYFAGNYRGANLGHLSDYNVAVTQTSYGAHYSLVEKEMHGYSSQLLQSLDKLSQVLSEKAVSDSQKLLAYCNLIAYFFAKFLIIHPYANGNGHMARMLVWVLLKNKGFTQNFWSVADRPGQPRGQPLDGCIELFRQGEHKPLIKYFLLGIETGLPVTVDGLLGAFSDNS